MQQQRPPMQPFMQPAMPRNAGDWQCPDITCQNHKSLVFSRHDSCPKCGSGKPHERGDISNPVDWQRPHTDCRLPDNLDEEMRSLYGRQELLEIWIWDRLRKTPRSAAQWESLYRDYDMLEEAPLTRQSEEGSLDPEGHLPCPQGVQDTPGLKTPLQAHLQEKEEAHMPISQGRPLRSSPY